MKLSGVAIGRDPNYDERQDWLRRVRPDDPEKLITLDWRFQCYCGQYTYFIYRRRLVCNRCGQWTHQTNPVLRDRFPHLAIQEKP